MNTFEIIVKEGLSIRRIPESITHCFEFRHFKEGDEIIERWGRKMCRRITIPKHPGWWMCKQVNDTSSRVEWSYAEDNLAPTLEESVALYYANPHKYKVIVGGVLIHKGNHDKVARGIFDNYVSYSKKQRDGYFAQFFGQAVTLLHNGETIKEYPAP